MVATWHYGESASDGMLARSTESGVHGLSHQSRERKLRSAMAGADVPFPMAMRRRQPDGIRTSRAFTN
eukprot:scaffold222635_cov31-Tisochrysis_lutea.AAC.1